MYGEMSVGREYRAQFQRDKTLQQARFQSSSTIDLASGTRLHLSPSHLLLFDRNFEKSAAPLGLCPARANGVKCHVSCDMGSWHPEDPLVSSETHEFVSIASVSPRLGALILIFVSGTAVASTEP